MMSGRLRIGLATTMLTFVGGMWVFFAPFVVGYQKVGAHWTEATRTQLWTGGVLTVLSMLALMFFAVFAIRDAALAAEQRRRQEAEPSEEG